MRASAASGAESTGRSRRRGGDGPPLAAAVPRRPGPSAEHGLVAVGLVLLALGAGAQRARAARANAGRSAVDRAPAGAARALALERAGIVHDLHDVVTHRLTTMVVQADAAQARLAGGSPETSAALAAIASSGRAALTELRDLLARLQPDPAPAGPGAAAGVGELARLLELAGGPGARPTLRVLGKPHPLPERVQVALYRTVQECVTNALRHAGGGATTVTVRYGDGLVELQVDSGSAGPSRVDGPGRGWLGVLRRAAELRGGLVAGPRPGGGYRVLVRLPDPGPA